jgi:integrase
MPKLTKSVVDSLTCTSSAPAFLWDDQLIGFGVKALPSGTKKFFVKYRTGAGGRLAKQRWIGLGAFGQLTCDQARAQAQQVLAAIARGEDPQGAKFKLRKAPRLDDLWSKFATDYLPRRKPVTRREYESQWRDIIKPQLGKLLVEGITRADMDKLHKGLAATPYRANRVLALCSRLMNVAEAIEWRQQGTNPCRYVERFKERARTRYLTGPELSRLGESLKHLVAIGDVQPSASNAIKLLLFSGARLNEILQAKWDWVDLERQLILLPDSKTGEKPIFLSAAALEILHAQREMQADCPSDYIFAGRSAGKHMINLRKPWMRVCQHAGITGVRLHDLRHTAASVAVGQGASLAIVGRLLGHTQAQTTMRYAHVDTDPALVAANLIGNVVTNALGLGGPKSQ